MSKRFSKECFPSTTKSSLFKRNSLKCFSATKDVLIGVLIVLLSLKVCEEEEVLELDAQSLGDLLASDDLNISQEQVVLELVLRWVQRRRGNPQSEAEAVELLRRVRLELVDPGFLRKARRRNPVRTCTTQV